MINNCCQHAELHRYIEKHSKNPKLSKATHSWITLTKFSVPSSFKVSFIWKFFLYRPVSIFNGTYDFIKCLQINDIGATQSHGVTIIYEAK